MHDSNDNPEKRSQRKVRRVANARLKHEEVEQASCEDGRTLKHDLSFETKGRSQELNQYESEASERIEQKEGSREGV